MTNNRPDYDAFAAEVRQQMEDTIRPVADKVVADVKRPYRRKIAWLLAGYGVFVVLSILQAILWSQR